MKTRFTFKELENQAKAYAPNAWERLRHGVWSSYEQWILGGMVQTGPDEYMEFEEWKAEKEKPKLLHDIHFYRLADRDGYGYRYIVKKGCSSWTAFHTIDGVKRFLSDYGFTLKLLERRGKWASFLVYGMPFEERMLWPDAWADIPSNAKTSYRLSNGDYTEWKIYTKGFTRILAHLNPNVRDRKTVPHFHE